MPPRKSELPEGTDHIINGAMETGGSESGDTETEAGLHRQHRGGRYRRHERRRTDSDRADRTAGRRRQWRGRSAAQPGDDPARPGRDAGPRFRRRRQEPDQRRARGAFQGGQRHRRIRSISALAATMANMPARPRTRSPASPTRSARRTSTNCTTMSATRSARARASRSASPPWSASPSSAWSRPGSKATATARTGARPAGTPDLGLAGGERAKLARRPVRPPGRRRPCLRQGGGGPLQGIALRRADKAKIGADALLVGALLLLAALIVLLVGLALGLASTSVPCSPG